MPAPPTMASASTTPITFFLFPLGPTVSPAAAGTAPGPAFP